MISIWQERMKHDRIRWVAKCQVNHCGFTRANDVRAKAWNRVYDHIKDVHPEVLTKKKKRK